MSSCPWLHWAVMPDDSLLWTHRLPRMVPKTRRPGELVWEFRKDHHTYTCQLQDHGEYGVEARSSRTAIGSPVPTNHTSPRSAVGRRDHDDHRKRLESVGVTMEVLWVVFYE